tara:strand:+ start:83381 stop:84826 length:1446 start_codon:yes stop_codon:yes gene_type:complete
MRKIKYLIYTFILLGIVSSCSDAVLDEIDTNPNVVTEAPLKSLLPQVIISYSNEVFGNQGSLKAGIMSEQTTAVLGFNGYDNFEAASTTPWHSGYLVLNDLKFIKAKAMEEEAWTYAGISDVIKAFTLTTMVDLFGDIPYTQSLQADVRNPEFDAHSGLYGEIHSILDEAIANLEKSNSAYEPADDDLVFGGDADMWVKTAYGLKARLYNKLSKLDATGSADDALDALANSFASKDENFRISIYANSIANSNPMVAMQQGQPQSAIGNGIFNAMTSFTPNGIIEEDPRSVIWFTTVGGARIPAPNGVADPDFTEPRMDGAVYSKPEFLKYNAAPLPILTYNELLFIEAEANFRLGNMTEAYDLYLDAVELSLEQAGDFNNVTIDPADISAYMAYTDVAPGEGSLTMETIITQKYIAYFKYQWLEAFNEVRRYDIIPITNPLGRANRLLYPTTEITRNPNTPVEQVNFFSIFENSTKLIWAF